MLSAGIDTVSTCTISPIQTIGLLTSLLPTLLNLICISFFLMGCIINFFFFQTTNSSTFLLYELAKNPQLQERVYNEVQSVMGDKPHPSWDDLQKMILIRNSVKEVMRMYIPTIVPRKIMEDTVIEGYLVPAGVSVRILCTYTHAHKKSLYIYALAHTHACTRGLPLPSNQSFIG